MALLEAKNLSKSFGSGAKLVKAVSDVSLSIDSGEILAFLGRNGAGKTTSIKMIAALLEPDAGTVTIDGVNPFVDRAAAHARLGAVLEGSRNLYLQLPVLDNLEYFGTLKGLSPSKARLRASELLEMFGLTHKAKAAVRELSRGMQQKISVAVSIIHKPKLLLLDEPTNGLDVESSEHIKQVLKALTADGLAVLLTTHHLEVAQEVSNRVAIIRDGSIIAEGNTKSLMKQFSAAAVTVTFAGSLDESQATRLSAMGVTIASDTPAESTANIGATEQKISVPESVDLYAVLDVLRPATIVSVTRQDADLTDVFLNLVTGKGGRHE